MLLLDAVVDLIGLLLVNSRDGKSYYVLRKRLPFGE